MTSRSPAAPETFGALLAARITMDSREGHTQHAVMLAMVPSTGAAAVHQLWRVVAGRGDGGRGAS
jgi:hypothetical protein